MNSTADNRFLELHKQVAALQLQNDALRQKLAAAQAEAKGMPEVNDVRRESVWLALCEYAQDLGMPIHQTDCWHLSEAVEKEIVAAQAEARELRAELARVREDRNRYLHAARCAYGLLWQELADTERVREARRLLLEALPDEERKCGIHYAMQRAGLTESEIVAALSQPAEQHDPLAVSDHCPECSEPEPECACGEQPAGRDAAELVRLFNSRDAARLALSRPAAEPTTNPSAAGSSMSLEVALDFADNPRQHHTMQAPADTLVELYEALRVLAAAYRAEQPAGDWRCPNCGYIDARRVTFEETCDACHQPVEWDESRIDVIGQNGNDGDHYAGAERESLPLMAAREWTQGAKLFCVALGKFPIAVHGGDDVAPAGYECFRIADTDKHGLPVIERTEDMHARHRYRVWDAEQGYWLYRERYAPTEIGRRDWQRIEDYNERGQEWRL